MHDAFFFKKFKVSKLKIPGLETEIKINIDINFGITEIQALNIDINFGITEIQILNNAINFGIKNIDINIDT